MRPLFDYVAVMQDQDQIRISNCRESVRNDKACPMSHKPVHSMLYVPFGARVYIRGRPIQN